MSASEAKQRGFTIIEVLIVLAIAGIIFGMIFMAVPTLQRNARNAQRKQDAALILSAVSRYELTNSGTFPDACDEGGTKCNTTFLVNKKLSFYDASKVKAEPLAPGSSKPAVTDVETIVVYNYQKCLDDLSGATSVGAGYRDTVVLFGVETGSGSAAQCQEL